MSATPADLDDFKKRNKKPLWGTFSVSLVVHVVVIGLLGGVVVFKTLERPPAQFAPPPPPAQPRLEPRKLEHQVKVKQQQQKSGRPRVSPRLSANKISEFSLPEIKSAPAKVKDPLKSTDVRSFGTGGLGSGVGGGTGAGGLGLGNSQVMMFGIKAKTERVAVLIDLSPSMVEDERGGFPGFDALKREVKDLVRSLNDGSFFNLIVYDTNVNTFRDDAVLANRKNKEEGAAWLDQYMADPYNFKADGTRQPFYKFKATTPLLETHSGGPTRQDLAIAAAMESGVDTIFLISDGKFKMDKKAPPEALKALEEMRKDPKFQAAQAKSLADWKEKQRLDTEARAKRGLPPRVVEGSGPESNFQHKAISWGMYSDAEVLEYIKSLGKFMYAEKGRRPPEIYVVGYMSDPSAETFLRMLATRNSGTFRRTRALVKPIDGGSTATAPKPTPAAR